MARAGKVVRTRRKAPRPDERRQFQRFPVDFEVDYRAEDTFLFAYVSNLSEMGIFVRTEQPKAPGTKLLLRFHPRGFSHPLEIDGVVQWINPTRDDGSGQPGMGVQFTNLGSSQRKALLELVQRLAYLDEDALKAGEGAS